MNNELFDSKIKELVDSCSETPSPEVWDRIEAGLDLAVRRRRLWKRVTYWSSAAAAAVGLFALMLVHQPDDLQVQSLAQLSEEQAGQPASVTGTSGVEEKKEEGIRVLQTVPELRAEASVMVPSALPAVTRTVHRAVPVSAPRENVAVGSRVSADRPSIYDRTLDMDYIAMADEVPASASKKPSLSLAAGGTLSPTSATGNVDFSQPYYTWGATGVSSGQGIVPVSEPEHYFPVSVGLELKYSFLNDRLGVGLGVNYTFLNSRYEALVDRRYQASVEQSVHYIGVPLNFYVSILSGNRISFYANVGGMLEKAVRLSYEITDLSSVRYQRNAGAEGVQWSANVGLGFEYRFLDFMGLYVDPRLTYFFDCDQPYSVRTEQPLQFNLEMGFRFHIGA